MQDDVDGSKFPICLVEIGFLHTSLEDLDLGSIRVGSLDLV